MRHKLTESESKKINDEASQVFDWNVRHPNMVYFGKDGIPHDKFD